MRIGTINCIKMNGNLRIALFRYDWLTVPSGVSLADGTRVVVLPGRRRINPVWPGEAMVMVLACGLVGWVFEGYVRW